MPDDEQLLRTAEEVFGWTEPPDHPHHPVFDSARELLDRYEEHIPHLDTGNQYAVGWTSSPSPR